MRTPSAFRPAPWAPAYSAWVGAARKRPAIWRLLLGLAVVVLTWSAATIAVVALPLVILSLQRGQSIGEISQQMDFIEALSVLPAGQQSVLVLLSFSGIWIGVWLAVRLFHRRGIASVLSGIGRWSWGHFWLGFAVAGGFALCLILLVLATGGEGLPAEVNPLAWGLLIIPMFLAVFVQAAGEELMFRGYMQQQLAARFRHPAVWILIPALIFGILHGGSDWRGLAYIAITAMIGIVTALTVWRTGSLAAAMGLHLGNNFSAFLVLGPEALPRMLQDPDIAKSMLTPTAVAIDMGFYFLLAVLLISRWNPLRPVSRSRRGG
ncbi:MAG: CPBP family intramembrane glutamic endopeptidase [Pseudomonadota bacterium]